MVYLSRLLLSFLSVDGGSSPFLGSPRGLRGRRSRQERPGVRPVADYEAYFAVFFPLARRVSRPRVILLPNSRSSPFSGAEGGQARPPEPPGREERPICLSHFGKKKGNSGFVSFRFRDLGEYFPEEEFPSFLFCFVFFSWDVLVLGILGKGM